MRVAVTGGSGKLGTFVVEHLLDHGWQVHNLDLASPRDDRAEFMMVDLADYGQAVDALAGAGFDAVVHLAAIPAPGLRPDSTTFANNTLSTYNVFEAAQRAGIRNIVWASSETVLGLPFDTPPPYAPVDEEYPGRPETAYSLSKLLGEQMAAQACRRDPTLKIYSLRFSNVMRPDDYTDYFPEFQHDPLARKWNLWSYIDGRDGARAVRKALEHNGTGAEIFVIANADSVMTTSSRELMAAVFPDVPIRRELAEHETLLSIDKARRVLGYEPEYSWRTA